MRSILAIAITLFSLSNLFADKVKLQNGAVIEGIVKDEGEKIVVETGLGSVQFNRKDVEAIEKGKCKLNEYYEKYDSVKDSKDADDFYKLAKWAVENRLPKFVRKLYEKVIELNPEHEGARRALGYQFYQGKWMTRDEVMAAMGFIKFRDKWMTEAEKELIIAHEKEKEAKVSEEKLRKDLVEKEATIAKLKDRKSNYSQDASPWQTQDYYPYYRYGVYSYYQPYTYFPDTYGVLIPLNNFCSLYPAGYSYIYTQPYYYYGLSINLQFNRRYHR